LRAPQEILAQPGAAFRRSPGAPDPSHLRRKIQKADRFWFAPSENKTESFDHFPGGMSGTLKLGARVVVFASMLVCSLTSVAQANPVVVGVDPRTVGRLSADDQSKIAEFSP